MSAMEPRARRVIAAFFLLLVTVLSGCAHNNPRDPLEPLNRGIYAFNDGLDTAIVKPIAQGYRAVLPQFVRTGIGNFFSNLDDVTVILNGLLQLKIPQAISDTGRLVINSTLGILGIFDVATHFGLEKHNEDFGQTLGYWGMGSGPYLMLPFFGPSSLRDGIGRLVDAQTDIVWQTDHMRTRNQFYGTRVIHHRERALDSEKVLDTAAIDRYTFIRDAYLQRRRSLIYDGNPPPEPEDDDPPVKPKSEAAPSAPTVLVDQFGNVVAGEQQTPGARSQQSGQPPLAPDKNATVPAATPAIDSLRSTPSDTADPPKANAPLTRAPVSAPVIRVWVSSANAR